jgi:hypothetical protein
MVRSVPPSLVGSARSASEPKQDPAKLSGVAQRGRYARRRGDFLRPLTRKCPRGVKRARPRFLLPPPAPLLFETIEQSPEEVGWRRMLRIVYWMGG